MPTLTDIWESHAPATMALMTNATVSYRRRGPFGQGSFGSGPFGTGALREDLSAIVKYVDNRPADAPLRTGNPICKVTLLNSVTIGVSPASDGKLLGDGIYCSPQPGITAKWCRIVRILSADTAMISLEVA